MTDAEKYLFDVHGYLVIEDALSPEELDAANAAVDHHADEISIRPNDLANESTTLRGVTGRGDPRWYVDVGKTALRCIPADDCSS